MAEVSPHETESHYRERPLGLYESATIDSNIDLRESNLGIATLLKGLDRNTVEFLIGRSNDKNDTELLKNTSDEKRFRDHASYAQWFEKGRTPYALTNEEDGLLALIWFGEKQPPRDTETIPHDNWHTVAFRSYGPFRGSGLMVPLSQRVFDEYSAEHPFVSYWLEVNTDNKPAKKLYEKLGFGPKKSYSASRRSIMELPEWRN